MTKLLLCLGIFASFYIKGQTVTSTCTAPDSIVKKYRKDADRLSIRRAYHINSTYIDSVTVNRTLSNTYLSALIAVYNATAVPARDTVVRLLNLHTKPNPEVGSLTVKASPSQPWMMNLQNGIVPTGNASIDYLMNKYYLEELTYYQSTPYDVVVFKTDTGCNMVNLSTKFAALSNVIGSDPANTFNDVKNITDSINPAFTMLVYSYGFGTCADGCDYRTFWTFKVYNDCSVEYLGRTGDEPGFVGIEKNAIAFENVKLFPNPAKDRLYIATDLQLQNAGLQILNMLGQPVLQLPPGSGLKQEIDIHTLATGVYFVKLSDGESFRVFKMVKE